MAWFSSRARLVILVEPEGGEMYWDSIYIFQVHDTEDWEELWSRAFQRALTLGRKQETEYRNGDGAQVRWKLKEIRTLDIIQDNSLDGAEIYSESLDIEAGTIVPFNATFDPDKSSPSQTGI